MMNDAGLITNFNSERFGDKAFALTEDGYKRINELKEGGSGSDVFIAMQFKNEQGQDRKDIVDAIKSACTACGFSAFLITEKQYNDGITDEILREIKKSRFVIADFTYGNNGAYWEAGFAQGAGREVIRCCERASFSNGGLHFDVKHYNTILWNSSEDLYSQLRERISALFK
jgi:hypothetical protein